MCSSVPHCSLLVRAWTAVLWTSHTEARATLCQAAHSHHSRSNTPGLMCQGAHTRPRQVVRELIERFEAHLTAGEYYSVVANMRGDSAEEVAAAILGNDGLRGLQVTTSSAEKTFSCP